MRFMNRGLPATGRLGVKPYLGVISQINTLSQAALHKKGCDAVLVVGCGEAKTVSLPLKLVNPKSLIARFSRKKAKPADTWIFGVDPQEAA